MKIIGLEEHFVVPQGLEAWRSLDPRWPDLAKKSSAEGEAGHRLLDFGTDRPLPQAGRLSVIPVRSETKPPARNGKEVVSE